MGDALVTRVIDDQGDTIGPWKYDTVELPVMRPVYPD